MAHLQNREEMWDDVTTFWYDFWQMEILGRYEAVLHHYTDKGGVQGIIESNRIWATHLSHVNDPTELMYGQNLLIEEWKALSGALNPDLARILWDVIRTIESGEWPNDIYGFCLSSESDLLSQWGRYADQCRGYSIGFNSDELDKRLGCSIGGSPGEFIPCRPLPMLYSAERQRAFLRQMPNRLLGIVEKWNRGILHPDMGVDTATEITGFFFAMVDRLVIKAFKHPSYKEENEVRCINLPSPPFPRPEPKFREKQGREVPYVELTMISGKLPIEEIIVGPALDYESARERLSALLEKNGYTGVQIKKSQIPYRA